MRKGVYMPRKRFMNKKTVHVKMGHCLDCNKPITAPVKFTDFTKAGRLCKRITVAGTCGIIGHIRPKWLVSYREFLRAAHGDTL